MISLLQNFVVTKQDRLNTLKETLPDIAKYFNDINFYVNYNSKINFKEVYSLYKEFIIPYTKKVQVMYYVDKS